MALEAEPSPLAKTIAIVMHRPESQDMRSNNLNPDGTKMANGHL
jgi:hypothetical protein